MTKTSSLKHEAEDHAAEVASHLKSSAAKTAESHIDAARNTAADHVDDVADAAHAAAAQFDPASLQAEAVRHIADRVDQLGEQIRNSDLEGVAGQVTTFARNNPALFIGAAALAGFAATRFLKARDRAPVVYSDDDVWGTDDHHATVISELNKEQRHG